MQPGLHKLGADEHRLTPLSAASRLRASKAATVPLGFHAEAGADTPATRRQFLRAIDTQTLPRVPALDSPQFWQELAMQVEEDLVLLGGDDMRARLLMVCSPSGWAPAHVLGKTFASIHAPVADNERILAASSGLVRTLLAGSWQRWVWTLSPSDEYDRHPERCQTREWPADLNAENFGSRAWLRVEHQKLIALPASDEATGWPQGVVFTIRVMLMPLQEAVRNTEQAQRLHDSLQSMSAAVLHYKNLTAARDCALTWLEQRAA